MSTDVVGTVVVRPIRPNGSGIRFDLLGDDTLEGGVGGWTSLERPRAAPVSEWTGTPALTLTLPLLLSGIPQGRGVERSIEADLRRLESWGKPSYSTKEPAIVKVTGPLRVASSLNWTLQTIEWGEQLRNVRGARIQQGLTLTLLQYEEPTLVRRPAAAARARARA